MSWKIVPSICTLVAILLCLIDASPPVFRMMQTDHRPLTASAKNCGQVPFNLTWSPDTLSPFGSVTITLDYKIPYTCNGGIYNVTVCVHGDPTPFITLTSKFTCDDIAAYVPCPLKAGKQVRMTKTIDNLDVIGAYPGDFDVHVEVKNQDGKEMVCMMLHIVVRDSF